VAFSWTGPGDRRRMVTVNYAGHRSQCYVGMPWSDRGRNWRLADRWAPTSTIGGRRLAAKGHYLDMPRGDPRLRGGADRVDRGRRAEEDYEPGSSGGRDELEERYRTERLLTRELRVGIRPRGADRPENRSRLGRDLERSPSRTTGRPTPSGSRRSGRSSLQTLPEIGDDLRWAVGTDALVLMTAQGRGTSYPYFSGSKRGPSRLSSSSIDDPSAEAPRPGLRPPRVPRDTLKKYPVLFNAGRQEPLLPEEPRGAPTGSGRVDPSPRQDDAIDRCRLGIHSGDGWRSTRSRVRAYGGSVVEEIVPWPAGAFG